MRDPMNSNPTAIISLKLSDVFGNDLFSPRHLRAPHWPAIARRSIAKNRCRKDNAVERVLRRWRRRAAPRFDDEKGAIDSFAHDRREFFPA